MTHRLICLIVCDSWGVGNAPDAADHGDGRANTLAHVAEAVGGLDIPNLEALGLGAITPIQGVEPVSTDRTAHGALIEVSAGKDSTTGHWELAGLRLDRPFPTYPSGFPADVIERFESSIGRKILGNVAASGTKILEELGEEHMRTGRPIVYTSADSVFQVAAHVGVVDLQMLYDWCSNARGILTAPHAVGRVIARPFDGEPGAFRRRPERRDFALEPPGPTLLDACAGSDIRVSTVGKIADLFSQRGVSDPVYATSDEDGVDRVIERLRAPAGGLVFANLVDFDSKYGHRNDPVGYAAAIRSFDARIPSLIEASGDGYLFITGDHGCDPTLPGTDHTREMTPILVHGGASSSYGGRDLGVTEGFGSVGSTIAELLDLSFRSATGASFAPVLEGHQVSP
jgi:phosphopentomutase